MITRWRLLAWLIAVAQITRAIQVHEWIWDRDPIGALTLIFGVALAFRPDSARLFLSVVGVRLANSAVRLPDVHNQEMIEAQVLTGVLLVWLYKRPNSDDERFAAAAPVIRAGLVTLYWVAAFQKLNVDFLNSELGCSSTIWRASVERWGLPAAWAGLGYPMSVATIAFEAILPVLLLWRWTRGVGLLFALAFHFWVGVDMGVYAFSAMMFAYLAAFTPKGWVRDWEAVQSPQRLILAVVAVTGAAAAAWVWFTVGARLSVLGLVWWGEIGILFLATSLYSASKSLGAEEPALPSGAGRLVWIPVALMLLNASSPYIGLKTMTSLSMYSNLRTEGDHWNHLLVPRSVKIFDFQDDLIAITGSSDPVYQAIADSGKLLPRFELRRRIRRFGDSIGTAWIDYRDDSGEYRIEIAPEAVGDPQGLLEGGSPILNKFLHFNRVDPGSRQSCRYDAPPMRRRSWW